MSLKKIKGGVKPINVLLVFFIIIIFAIAYIVVTGKLAGSATGLRNMLNKLLCVGC